MKCPIHPKYNGTAMVMKDQSSFNFPVAIPKLPKYICNRCYEIWLERTQEPKVTKYPDNTDNTFFVYKIDIDEV